MREKYTLLDWLAERYFPEAEECTKAFLALVRQTDVAVQQFKRAIGERAVIAKGVLMQIAIQYHAAWKQIAPLILATEEVARFLREAAVALPKIREESARKLREAGFFAVPSMPASIGLGAADPAVSLEAVRQEVIGWLDPRIETMAERWFDLSVFQPARNLIHNAIDLYREDEYRAVVAMLTPVPEGVVTRFLWYTYGLDVAENLRSRPNRKIKKILEAYEYASEEVQNDALCFMVIDTIEFAFVEQFYGNTMGVPLDRLMDEANAYLNRHDFSHGYDLEYGTQEGALRCFLLLELLSHVFEAISAKHDQPPGDPL